MLDTLTCAFVFSCWHGSAVWCLCVGVCVKPEALVLLLVQPQMRGAGHKRYAVDTHLHLTLCAEIPSYMWDEYHRIAS